MAEKRAKRSRILTEKELRREQLQPVTRAVSQTGKGILGAGKLIASGIKKLGEMGKTQPPPAKKSQGINMDIDIGFGKGGKTGEPPLDLGFGKRGEKGESPLDLGFGKKGKKGEPPIDINIAIR